MNRAIKFRAWGENIKEYMSQSFDGEVETANVTRILGNLIDQGNWIIEQYAGLKDKNGDKEIYEYDIIDGEGNIIGNYHETPELLKDKTNLLIQGFGTKTWLATYQEAVERGCHDA